MIIKRFTYIHLSFIVISILFFLSVWYGAFGDEQENFAAGWLISQGLLPYKDFFFHHTPVPFFISSILFIQTHHNFWLFRVVVLIFHFLSWIFLIKLLPRKWAWSVPLFILLLCFSIPVFLMQMFLADTLAAIALVVLSVAWWTYLGKTTKLHAEQVFWVTVICSTVAVWSSITSVLSVFVILGTAAVYLGWGGIQKFVHEVGYTKLLVGTLLFFSIPLFYFVTGNWSSFYWSVYEYNQSFYFPYRLASTPDAVSHNFLTTILENYYNFLVTTAWRITIAFYLFLLTIKTSFITFLTHHSLSTVLSHWWIAVVSLQTILYTYQSLAVLSLLITVLYCLIYQRRWVIPLILLSITLRSRTNEIFHESPFYVAVWLLLCVVLISSYQKKQRNFFYITTALYVSWISILFPTYWQYIREREPIVLPEMQIQAEYIQKYSKPNDRLLVLGGNTMYYLLSEHLPATKQMYYLPWFAIVPQMHDEVANTILEKRADVVLLEDFSQSYEKEHFAHDIAEDLRANYKLVEQKIFVATTAAEIKSQ